MWDYVNCVLVVFTATTEKKDWDFKMFEKCKFENEISVTQVIGLCFIRYFLAFSSL
jgi:hypothetical protein